MNCLELFRMIQKYSEHPALDEWTFLLKQMAEGIQRKSYETMLRGTVESSMELNT